MKRCWCSCWCFESENEISFSKSPHVKRRKTIDPVVKEAEENEIKRWNRKIRKNRLALRIITNPPEFASTDAVVFEIIEAGLNDMNYFSFTMTLEPGTPLRLRPSFNTYFSALRPHKWGCDYLFPYDRHTEVMQLFVDAIRKRLINKHMEKVVSISVLTRLE
jgi:hypothetical protein